MKTVVVCNMIRILSQMASAQLTNIYTPKLKIDTNTRESSFWKYNPEYCFTNHGNNALSLELITTSPGEQVAFC